MNKIEDIIEELKLPHPAEKTEELEFDLLKILAKNGEDTETYLCSLIYLNENINILCSLIRCMGVVARSEAMSNESKNTICRLADHEDSAIRCNVVDTLEIMLNKEEIVKTLKMLCDDKISTIRDIAYIALKLEE